jgi:hypothetical protein
MNKTLTSNLITNTSITTSKIKVNYHTPHHVNAPQVRTLNFYILIYIQKCICIILSL